MAKKPDSIYFEDIISKAIVFRAGERVYGVKPNAIGDMRYITVPYSIALFNYYTKGKLDLYKIWKNQSVSSNFKTLLHSLMMQVEAHIKRAAPGSLYGEWAKKEDCWEDVKKQKFDIEFKLIADDLIDPKNPPQRRRISEDDAVLAQIEADIEVIRSVPGKVWSEIENWGKVTASLTDYQLTIAWNLAHSKRTSKISDAERNIGLKIIDIVKEIAPEILHEIDNISIEDMSTAVPEITISQELVKKLVSWDKKHKRLKDHEYLIMVELSEGKRVMTPRYIQLATLSILKAKKYGFKE